MSEQRQRRVVRPPDSTQPHQAKAPERKTYLDQWPGVVSGIFSEDLDAGHRRITHWLRAEGKTGSALIELLSEAGDVLAHAHRLAVRARADYDVYKEDVWERWMEIKRTAARLALEEEKKNGDLKKQITDQMITDQVRATWPDEYATELRRFHEFRAAVHELETLPDSVKVRARALDSIKEIVLATR